jgi:hypothetical protein
MAPPIRLALNRALGTFPVGKGFPCEKLRVWFMQGNPFPWGKVSRAPYSATRMGDHNNPNITKP